ncbi:MAG: Crp/Fnr family transcriptional regulator [Paracoccaceae bacterium]|nr:Crp/Fnr family transcriptional regulator [Paracoccaceae bacterium]
MNVARSVRGSPILNPCTLSKTGWLAEQPADFQERMVALGGWRTFRAGQSLYEVGDPSNGVFGLETGLVDISIPISDDEMVTLHRAGPGLWGGDSALFADVPRIASLTAHTDSLVFVLPARALKQHIAERPTDLLYFYKLNHRNFELAIRALAEVIALSPRARFARLLLRLASGGDLIRATQTELGKLAGMSRAAFRRAFSELLDAGIVKTEYGKVRITDRAALEAEAARR